MYCDSKDIENVTFNRYVLEEKLTDLLNLATENIFENFKIA